MQLLQALALSCTRQGPSLVAVVPAALVWAEGSFWGKILAGVFPEAAKLPFSKSSHC